MFADISFTTESMVAIGGLMTTLTGAVAYIFKLLMQAKNDQIALALEMSKKKSFESMLDEALVIMETRVAGKLEGAGKPGVKPLAPVVPESNSPATPEQKAVAEVASARARLTAVALAVGAPVRVAGDDPATRPTPAGVVAEQLRTDIAGVAEDVKAVPGRVAEKLKEDADASPPGEGKP